MAWEQVSHNDVALTDVGQLLISLPNSAPISGRTLRTHATPPRPDKSYCRGFFWTRPEMKSRPEVTAAKPGGDVTSVAGPRRHSIRSESALQQSERIVNQRGGKQSFQVIFFFFISEAWCDRKHLKSVDLERICIPEPPRHSNWKHPPALFFILSFLS